MLPTSRASRVFTRPAAGIFTMTTSRRRNGAAAFRGAASLRLFSRRSGILELRAQTVMGTNAYPLPSLAIVPAPGMP